MIWIVGQAGPCALGHVPGPGDSIGGGASFDRLELNVSVLGWPRVIEVDGATQLHVDEEDVADCHPVATPAATP